MLCDLIADRKERMSMITKEKPPLDELIHFGVLGMKWGKRKKVGLTDSQKKKLKIAVIAAGSITAIAIGTYFAKQYMTNHGAETLKEAVNIAKSKNSKDFVDTILKKNETMDRITKNIEFNSDYTNRTFVANDFLDRALYKETMPAFWRGQGYTGPVFKTEMKAINKIIAPSTNKTQKILEEAVSKNSEHVRSFFKNNGTSMNSMTDGEITKKYFKALSGKIADLPVNDPFVKTYLDLLSKKGYNAVVDYNDAGGFASKPLILLNAARDTAIIDQFLLRRK